MWPCSPGAAVGGQEQSTKESIVPVVIVSLMVPANLTCEQALLTTAAERQSEACGLAALALLSAASAGIRTSQQLASAAALGAVLHTAQLLVATMVAHPAPGVRNAGFHALEDVLLALAPGGV